MPTPKGTKPWNAGTSKGWIDRRGYRWLIVHENGRRVSRREHRVIMERHLGRKLEPWEVVHHKDRNTANNAIENLEVKEAGAHTAEHHKGAKRTDNTRMSMKVAALMREALKREREVKSDLLAALQGLVAAFVTQEAYPAWEDGGDNSRFIDMADAETLARAALARATPPADQKGNLI